MGLGLFLPIIFLTVFTGTAEVGRAKSHGVEVAHFVGRHGK